MRRSAWLVVALFGCGTTDPSAVCPAMGEPAGRSPPISVASARDITSFALGTNTLYYLNKADRQIHKTGLDGVGAQLLYTSPNAQSALMDLVVKNDVLYASEQENAVARISVRLLTFTNAAPKSTELTMNYVGFFQPVPGDDVLYMKVANDGSAIGQIGRLTPATAAIQTLLGPEIIEQPTILKDAIFYLTRDAIGDDATKRRMTRAPKMPATGTTIPNTFCRGSQFTTANNIFCSGYTNDGLGEPSSSIVTKTGLDGKGATPWVTFKGNAEIALTVGDEAIVRTDQGILAANLSTGALRAISCTARRVQSNLFTGRPLILLSGDTLFWVQDGASASDPSTVYKAPLR